METKELAIAAALLGGGYYLYAQDQLKKLDVGQLAWGDADPGPLAAAANCVLEVDVAPPLMVTEVGSPAPHPFDLFRGEQPPMARSGTPRHASRGPALYPMVSGPQLSPAERLTKCRERASHHAYRMVLYQSLISLMPISGSWDDPSPGVVAAHYTSVQRNYSLPRVVGPFRLAAWPLWDGDFRKLEDQPALARELAAVLTLVMRENAVALKPIEEEPQPQPQYTALQQPQWGASIPSAAVYAPKISRNVGSQDKQRQRRLAEDKQRAEWRTPVTPKIVLAPPYGHTSIPWDAEFALRESFPSPSYANHKVVHVWFSEKSNPSEFAELLNQMLRQLPMRKQTTDNERRLKALTAYSDFLTKTKASGMSGNSYFGSY